MLSSFAALAPASLAIDPGSYDSSHILVRFRPEEIDQNPANILPGSAVEHALDLVPGLQVIRLPESVAVADALTVFQASPSIFFVQPNYRVRAQLAANDPGYTNGYLWNLHNTGQQGGTPDADIDAFEAWEITTGSPSLIVAVIDTGVDYTHPDLVSNMWINYGEIAGDH